MSRLHAKPDPIAEAEVLQIDADGRYRWYEEEADSEVHGVSLYDAIENAEPAWRGFQLLEVRGKQVGIGAEFQSSFSRDELLEAGDHPES